MEGYTGVKNTGVNPNNMAREASTPHALYLCGKDKHDFSHFQIFSYKFLELIKTLSNFAV